MSLRENLNIGVRFMKEPSKTFDSMRKTALREGFKYILVMAAIFAVLNSMVSALMVGYAQSVFMLTINQLPLIVLITFVTGTIAAYALIVVLSIIWGLWLHLWVYMFGARGTLEQTLKSVFYGQTPMYLIGWIPFLNIVFGIWAMVWTGIGIKRLHGFQKEGMIALAFTLALGIPVLLISVLAVTFLLSMIPLMGGIV